MTVQILRDRKVSQAWFILSKEEMELEMWRRVLLFFFVVRGAGGEEGTNKEVFGKLCDIAGNVSVLMKESGVANSHLDEALYGEGGRERFGDDGSVSAHGCVFGVTSRSQYCSHIQGGALTFGGSSGHGCFADSLQGTFLCLCTKGHNGEQDLCGLGNVGNGASWSGGIAGDSYERGLLNTVWDKIKRHCVENKEIAVNAIEHWRNLENSVYEIKSQAQNKKLSNGKTYLTLGGISTHGHCSGTSQGDACVTYPTKYGNEPHIPWADKILTAINISRTHQKASFQDSDPTAHHQDSDDPSDHDTSDEESEEESVNSSTYQNPGPQDPSKPSRPRRKRRSTNKQPTEQPAEPLRAILHDDGSLLPQPFWLLSAVVII